jgi:hypothetical protein
MENEYKAKKLIEGKGVLFTNLNKIDDYSPDMKGELLYKGELIRIGGWIRDTKMGRLISIGVDKVKGDDYYGNNT